MQICLDKKVILEFSEGELEIEISSLKISVVLSPDFELQDEKNNNTE